MDISICRQSVCMADDVDDHTITYTIESSTTFSDIFLDLIKKKYFPRVSGNDVVWTLFCGDDDLMSWKTKENKIYSRFVDEEPTIFSIKRWTTAGHINFCYYPSPIKRAQQIFTKFRGLKNNILQEGFMPEYKSYHIPQTIEDDWRKQL